MDILEFLHKAKKLNAQTLSSIIEQSANDLQPKITKLQKEQLSLGEDSEGKVIGYYTPFTQFMASKSNPLKPKVAGQPYNFQWSGNLFKGLFSNSKLLSNNLIIETDSKARITDKLERRYTNLLGLNPRGQQIVTNMLQEQTIYKINNFLK